MQHVARVTITLLLSPLHEIKSQYRRSQYIIKIMNHCGNITCAFACWQRNGLTFKMATIYIIVITVDVQLAIFISPLSFQNKENTNNSIVPAYFYFLNICKGTPPVTRTASSRRLHGVQENSERVVRAVGSNTCRAPKDRHGIAVASPLDVVGSQRTPRHGAHFVHAQSAHRGSAFPRRSEWAPWERSRFSAAAQ